jgi:hypothetical protein
VRIRANNVDACVRCSTLLPDIRPHDPRQSVSVQQIIQFEGPAVAIPLRFESPLPHQRSLTLANVRVSYGWQAIRTKVVHRSASARRRTSLLARVECPEREQRVERLPWSSKQPLPGILRSRVVCRDTTRLRHGQSAPVRSSTQKPRVTLAFSYGWRPSNNTTSLSPSPTEA